MGYFIPEDEREKPTFPWSMSNIFYSFILKGDGVPLVHLLRSALIFFFTQFNYVPAGTRLTLCLATMMQFTFIIFGNLQPLPCSTMRENAAPIFTLSGSVIEPPHPTPPHPLRIVWKNLSSISHSTGLLPESLQHVKVTFTWQVHVSGGGCVCYFRPSRPLLFLPEDKGTQLYSPEERRAEGVKHMLCLLPLLLFFFFLNYALPVCLFLLTLTPL